MRFVNKANTMKPNPKMYINPKPHVCPKQSKFNPKQES